MVRAPVHGALAFLALLVGGRELPGEQVAWPEPAARDNQPQRFPGPEEGRGRPEGYVGGDDLPWGQRLTLGAGGHRVKRPGTPLVEGSHRCFQPAGGDAVAAESVGPFKGDVAASAPFLHA